MMNKLKGVKVRDDNFPSRMTRRMQPRRENFLHTGGYRLEHCQGKCYCIFKDNADLISKLSDEEQ